MRTRTNSGVRGSSEIAWTAPTGTPEKTTADPVARPSTAWRKKMSYSLRASPDTWLSQMMKASTAAIMASTTPPTRMWFERVSIRLQPPREPRSPLPARAVP
jgi:hypothetical protein